MHYWGYSCGAAWGMMFLGMLVFLLFAAILIYILLRRAPFHGIKTYSDTPLEILRRRYARGEINREQFEQMRHDLEL